MYGVIKSFVTKHRENASRWKLASLPPAAHAPGRFGRDTYDYCLPAALAELNLLPSVRETALAAFAELDIAWWRGIGTGPTNHLLSSQVQCVNALAAMMSDPVRIVRVFGDKLDIDEVMEIEAGRFLTFEFVPETDYLSEAVDGVLTRGANCTSVDAAFRYRTGGGAMELALVEWKFTESYSTRHDPVKTATRAGRYGHLLEATDGPIRRVLFEWLLDEPFYQLMRQQLLARALESDPASPYSAVRVLHVLDPANYAYQASIVNPLLREFGDTVNDIWTALLRAPGHFLHIDPAVFLDPLVTSSEYVARYGFSDLVDSDPRLTVVV